MTLFYSLWEHYLKSNILFYLLKVVEFCLSNVCPSSIRKWFLGTGWGVMQPLNPLLALWPHINDWFLLHQCPQLQNEILISAVCKVLVRSEYSIPAHWAPSLSRHSVISSLFWVQLHSLSMWTLGGSWHLTQKVVASTLPANCYSHRGQAGFYCSANLLAGHWRLGECSAVCKLAWCRQVLSLRDD